MKVLITGGAGFIGSHLCDSRVALGDEVIIFDNFSTGSSDNLKHLDGTIRQVSGNINDIDLTESLIGEVDLVLHMAAAVGVNTILDNPIESIFTNFTGSEVVLNACSKMKKRIVIASTSEIYGKNLKQPLAETDDRIMGAPQKIRWSYADSKALEEALAYSHHLKNNLNVTTVRFFNVVGPRQSGAYGMVLPRFVKAALNNQPLYVYGDGKQQRVFCHVYDAVDAINGLIDNLKSIGEVFNIGGIEEISIFKLANLVISKLGSSSKIVLQPYEESYGLGFEDMQRRVPDLAKIKSTINWSPRLDLTRIISDVANYLN